MLTSSQSFHSNFPSNLHNCFIPSVLEIEARRSLYDYLQKLQSSFSCHGVLDCRQASFSQDKPMSIYNFILGIENGVRQDACVTVS